MIHNFSNLEEWIEIQEICMIKLLAYKNETVIEFKGQTCLL